MKGKQYFCLNLFCYYDVKRERNEICDQQFETRAAIPIGDHKDWASGKKIIIPKSVKCGCQGRNGRLIRDQKIGGK